MSRDTIRAAAWIRRAEECEARALRELRAGNSAGAADWERMAQDARRMARVDAPPHRHEFRARVDTPTGTSAYECSCGSSAR